MNKYKCEHCLQTISNIINYVNHTNEHKIKYGEINISVEILHYLIEYKIEPYQWEDKSGNLYLSYDFDNDFDILLMAINELDHEVMALDILNLLNPENTSGQYHFDDEEKKREYLISKNIDVNDIDNYSYNEFEDFCHFTNNSLLMLCIKKNGINFV